MSQCLIALLLVLKLALKTSLLVSFQLPCLSRLAQVCWQVAQYREPAPRQISSGPVFPTTRLPVERARHEASEERVFASLRRRHWLVPAACPEPTADAQPEYRRPAHASRSTLGRALPSSR